MARIDDVLAGTIHALAILHAYVLMYACAKCTSTPDTYVDCGTSVSAAKEVASPKRYLAVAVVVPRGIVR